MKGASFNYTTVVHITKTPDIPSQPSELCTPTDKPWNRAPDTYVPSRFCPECARSAPPLPPSGRNCWAVGSSPWAIYEATTASTTALTTVCAMVPPLKLACGTVHPPKPVWGMDLPLKPVCTMVSPLKPVFVMVFPLAFSKRTGCLDKLDGGSVIYPYMRTLLPSFEDELQLPLLDNDTVSLERLARRNKASEPYLGLASCTP